MTFPAALSIRRITAVGLLAFVVLAIRFSPNWIEFHREFQTARAQARDATERAAIEHAFLITTSVARGTHVMRQVTDLSAEIGDPNHQIVRWRLLFPAVGHFLNIPGKFVLGLAWVGCMVFTLTLSWIGFNARRSTVDAFCLAIVGGATAPFFTSMGWLGYFDVWLALALLVVAFVRARAWVLVSCFLGPWVDERMVIGLPLALCVRWAYFSPDGSNFRPWLRRDVLPAMLVVVALAALRLGLGGTGGSQTVGSYWTHFIFTRSFDVPRLLLGAWEGLRVGWPLLLYITVEGVRALGSPANRGLQLLAIGLMALLTAGIGLVSALDISRSMVLLVPVVSLGWTLVCCSDWWSRLHVPAFMAAAAVLIPANHVVTRFVMAVDNVWSTPFAVPEAFIYVGASYATGQGISRNDAEALRWFRRAEQLGSTPALTNLGILYFNGQGVAKNSVEAARLFRIAAERGDAPAQCHMGRLYALGDGLPMNYTEALKWFQRSARQGNKEAQENLGLMYKLGLDVPRDAAEAIKWYRRAAIQGNAEAQTALADMYATGLGGPKDPVAAAEWYLNAASRGHVRAQYNLGVLYANGEGVRRDDVEAMAWFYHAAASGDAAVQQLVELGEKKLSDDQRAQARKRSGKLLQPSPNH